MWHPDTNTDYFFITLQKSEKDYSPSTRYRDYAISPELFTGSRNRRRRKRIPLDNATSTTRTALERDAVRSLIEERRVRPHAPLHLSRPGAVLEPHRRAPDGHRLETPAFDAAGRVRRGPGGGGVNLDAALLTARALRSLLPVKCAMDTESTPTPDSAAGWRGDFQSAKERLLDTFLATTPSERLRWLEEALAFAQKMRSREE